MENSMMPNAAAPQRFRAFRRAMRKVLHSPKFEIALGASIFFIGLVELIEESLVILFPTPDLHHALLLFGAVTALRGLVDVVEGAEQIAEGELHARGAGHGRQPHDHAE